MSQSILAKDIMTAAVISVEPDTTMHDATQILLECKVSGLPVIENGRLVGIISEVDRLKLHGKCDEQTLVRDCMSKTVVTIQQDATLQEILDILLKRNIRRVPVLRGDHVVGIVSRHDVVRGLEANFVSAGD